MAEFVLAVSRGGDQACTSSVHGTEVGRAPGRPKVLELTLGAFHLALSISNGHVYSLNYPYDLRSAPYMLDLQVTLVTAITIM